MASLSPAIADTALSRWPERAAAWIDALPHELADVCDALSVTPTGRTFSARSAYVIEATTSTGARLILRMSRVPWNFGGGPLSIRRR